MVHAIRRYFIHIATREKMCYAPKVGRKEG
jgi:hypothetical protein